LPTTRLSRPTRVHGYRFAVRNRYLDLLRAAAIARVVVYHLFGWPWLSIVLPAMGVMFALAGSLTAASLDRRNAAGVVTSRLRRLLPPVWLLGLIAVPIMLAYGWGRESDGEHPFSPLKLVYWLVPVVDPPGSDHGLDIWEPLWYIRAYLWFVVLSPVLYLAYRKTGWLTVVAPIGLIALLDKTGFTLPDAADAALWDFVTYGACWIAGFAHHDGRLARLRPATVIVVAVGLGATAMYWLVGHQGPDRWDLNDVSESQALWSLAFVLLVLRWQPPMEWLARFRPLDRTVSLLNARAVTIYLWHNIAIAAVWPVLTVAAMDDLGSMNGVVDLATALALTAVAVLAFGWVEDLAARRRPRLWPDNTPPRGPSSSRTGPDSGSHAPAESAGPGVPAESAGPGVPAATLAGPAPDHAPDFGGPAYDPALLVDRPVVEFGLASDPTLPVPRSAGPRSAPWSGGRPAASWSADHTAGHRSAGPQAGQWSPAHEGEAAAGTHTPSAPQPRAQAARPTTLADPDASAAPPRPPAVPRHREPDDQREGNHREREPQSGTARWLGGDQRTR
jgi:peptidoglycan/LPS O-acetylase OafA/YrhL